MNMDRQVIIDKLYKARWCMFVFVVIASEPVLQLLYYSMFYGLTKLGYQLLVACVFTFFLFFYNGFGE
jgi:hypothetical protein